ncbi:tRNA threonylcarbamoyladenosine biosynthesis protein TsaB [subsurface metagenome]
MSDLVLAIETSSIWTGVALAEKDKILAERSVESRSRHNEVLSGLIQGVMDQTAKDFADLSVLGVSIGPGSFTALRIGLLFAKGIAFAHSLKIVPVMTLDVLNASLEIQDDLEFRLPVLDAYKGEVFTALYRGSKRVSEPVIVDPAFIASLAGSPVHTEPVRVFGPASLKYEGSLRASLGERLHMPEDPQIAPTPSALALLAYERRKDAQDPADLEPFYLRMPDAKKPKP